MIQCQKKNKIKNDFYTYALINDRDIGKTVTSPWFNVLTRISHTHK
jgi:hypothetical protein